MADTMNERLVFVRRLVTFLAMYNIHVRYSEVNIQHIGARSGMVEWSLVRESVDKSCNRGKHLSSIMSTHNGRPSDDLKDSFHDFEIKEVRQGKFIKN